MQSSKYTTTTFWKPLSRKRSILWNKHPIFTRKLGSCSFSKNIKWKRIWWGVAALDPKLCMIKSSHRRCSIKKVFLKISQISHENTFVGVSFLKCFRAKAFNFIKKRYFDTCVFLRMLRNFYRTPPGNCLFMTYCGITPFKMVGFS